MDWSFSDDQIELRDLARKILGERVTNERQKEIARTPERCDRELWAALARAGLVGVALPEACGGAGLGIVEWALVLQEVGRVVAPIPALATLALGAQPLAELGSDAQQRRWLPGVAAGSTLLTGALGEPGGIDPRRPALRATRDARHFRLDGVKSAVPWASLAERIVVSARTGERSGGLFLVDPAAAGATLVPQEVTSREPHAELTLAGAVGEPLGDPGAGWAAVERAVDLAVLGICVTQLGVTERMLELTAEYGRERRQFDRPIGSFQAFHQRAADAYVTVEALRLATWQALSRVADGAPAAAELALARYWASEPSYRVAYACSHLHGGIGSDTDYPLHRYYLWTKQLELSLGTGMDQLRAIGRDLAEVA